MNNIEAEWVYQTLLSLYKEVFPLATGNIRKVLSWGVENKLINKGEATIVARFLIVK